MFCAHKWKLISETTTKSRIEVLRQCGLTSAKDIYKIADRKFIQIFSCDKCGQFKRFVEEI